MDGFTPLSATLGGLLMQSLAEDAALTNALRFASYGGTADTTHAYSVNTIDLFGLPIRSDSFGDILINSAAGSLTATTLVTAATSYVAADRSTPTATTGDVRGTYAGFTSSTGANKLIVRQSPQPYNLLSATGLFGATQYATF